MPPEVQPAIDTKTTTSSAGRTNGAAAAAQWYEPLKPDADTLKFITDHGVSDLNQFGKMTRDFEGLARGRNVIAKPDPDKLLEWNGYELLGWKPKFDEYNFKAPQVPDGVKLDPEVEAAIRKSAHDRRVPLSAAEAVYHDAVKVMVGKLDKLAAARAKADVDLQAELDKNWGADKERNVELSRRAFRHFGFGDGADDELEKIIGSPRLVAFGHKLASMIGEDKLPGGGGGGAMPESAAAIEAELDRLQSDPEFIKVLRNERDPRFSEFTARRLNLITKLSALQQRAASPRR